MDNFYRVKSFASDFFAAINFAVYCFLGEVVLEMVRKTDNEAYVENYEAIN